MFQEESISLKGFIVPAGYVLMIEQDGEIIVKDSGESSGGPYSYSEVLEGRVPNWRLESKDYDADFIQPKLPNEIYDIMDGIRKVGGQPLFVGGIVRDALMGIESKDVDIEVFGIPAETLQAALAPYGKVDAVGVSFGVIKLTTEEGDYDFSLPRRETKSGKGHRGFEVEPDYNMTPMEATSRRDYTINGIVVTPEGKVLDYFGGRRDLSRKVLRHISDKFSEDPLRVLRGMQFASRFDMVMAKDTADLAKSLKSEYKSLAKERIWTEWEKWAVKGDFPSRGLELLRHTGWIDFYPELKSLQGVPQEEEWHPEGDVWTHTLHVVDEAAHISKRDNLPTNERLILLLAALCHDLGKPNTTTQKDGRWTAPGHDREGEVPTRELLTRLGAPEAVINSVIPLVVEHMAHLNEINARSVRRLSNRLYPARIDQLVRVIEADHSGRPPLPKELPASAAEMLKVAEELQVHESKPLPLIQGRNLLALAQAGRLPAGYLKGGPHFKQALDILFQAQLDGVFSTEEEGENYVESILSETKKLDTREKYVYLASLSFADFRKLVTFANSNKFSESDVLSLSKQELQSIVKG